MSLWKPYADNSALDVTVAGPSRVSPSSGYIPHPIEEDSLFDDREFKAFERDAISVMTEKNGGTLLGHNPRMRRALKTRQNADDSYRERRDKNNVSAKKSRDRRKLREIRQELKVTYLKNEVNKLKSQLASPSCTRCRTHCLYLSPGRPREMWKEQGESQPSSYQQDNSSNNRRVDGTVMSDDDDK